MSQIDDLNAIKTYLSKGTAKTPKALAKQVEFKLWADNLSWFDQNASEDTMARARRFRDDFNTLNGATAAAAFKANDLPAPKTPTRLTIKLGSTGDNVKEWQTFLKTVPDGRFGPDTRLKTIAYQKNNGLFADGVVGPITWQKALGLSPVQNAVNTLKDAASAIISPIAKAAASITAPTASTNAPLKDIGVSKPAATSRVASTSASTTILKLGSKGQDVKNWQKVLGITASGDFDANTVKVTKEWQARHDLESDGVVGPMSWTAAIVLENQPKKNVAATTAIVAKSAITKSVNIARSLPLWQKIVGSAVAIGLTFLGVKAIKGPTI